MPNTTNLKGPPMKYKHFDDIRPNHNINFTMLYFAACRSLCKLEAAIRCTNCGKLYLPTDMVAPPDSKQICANGRIPQV